VKASESHPSFYAKWGTIATQVAAIAALATAIINGLNSCTTQAKNDKLTERVTTLEQSLTQAKEETARAQADAAAKEKRTLDRFIMTYLDAIRNANAKLASLQEVVAEKGSLGKDYQGKYNSAVEEFRNSLAALVDIVDKGRNDLTGLSEAINALTDHNIDELKSGLRSMDEPALKARFEPIRDSSRGTVDSLNNHLDSLAQMK
jgi:DNA repair exonuclease SbcCD ATPase subunit